MSARQALRVLLVEDDPVASQALQAYLRAGSPRSDALRIAVTSASTLTEAVREVEAEAFDAILLDLTLPDSSGAETYKRMLAAAGNAAVVVLTGVDDDILALDALLAGAQDYLVKGEVGRNALLRSLQHAVQRKAAIREATNGAGGTVDPELRRHLDLLEAEHTIIRRMLSSSPPKSDTTALEPGGVVAGRYRLGAVLGRGANGVTFRAQDEVLQRPCVLKALAREGGETGAREFLREARLAAGVEHPRVVGIRDFGLAGSAPYIVMEYVEGPTLADKLAAAAPFAPADAARIALDVLDGLAEIHRNRIVHRDLKPANVILADEGATIIDFGLATAVKDPTLTGLAPPGTPGEGTLAYISPEALEGLAPTPASDLYAAGAILFEMIAGRPYFGEGLKRRADIERAILHEPPKLPSEAHASLGAIALRALEKEPEKRYASAAAMRDEILGLKLA